MTSKLRACRFLIVGALALVAKSDLSAQLLPGLLTGGQSTSSTACSVASLASSPKLDAALQVWARDGAAAPQPVIVSAASGALPSVASLLVTLNATVLNSLPGINALVARVDLRSLGALACASSVSSVSLDAVVIGTTDAGVEQPLPGSLRDTLGLPQNNPAGSGVTVAVIDSGIAATGDLGNRIVAFFDLSNGIAPLPVSPSDTYGHGTHVAGLIAGAGVLDGAGRYQGVGPNVRLLGMKVLDAHGTGRTSDVIRAVQLTTTLRPVLGVDVINLSLGHPIYEPAARDPLVRAVEAASRAGIVVVAAAGNFGYNAVTGEVGYGGITSPGNAPSAITVGSVMTQDTRTRHDDRIAPYSSRGPSWYDGLSKPDIVAPGHRLVSDTTPNSTLYESYPTARVSSNYLRLSGTSMAAAVTSGSVALVLEAYRQAHPNAPPLTPNLVKGILQYSSLRLRDQFGIEYDELTQGAGSLNPPGAMAIARAIDTTRPLGWYWLTAGLTAVTTVDGEVVPWSQRVLWRTQTVLGPTIDTRQAAWGLNTAWGGANAWDSHIVWGTDTVWGNAAPTWSSHIVWGTNLVGASDDGDHIVWGTSDEDHIVWGTSDDEDHIVWGTTCGPESPSCGDQ